MTAEKNFYGEKLKYVKSKRTVPSCSEGVVKSHPFSKISKDRKHR